MVDFRLDLVVVEEGDTEDNMWDFLFKKRKSQRKRKMDEAQIRSEFQFVLDFIYLFALQTNKKVCYNGI